MPGANESKKKEQVARDIHQFKSPEVERRLIPSNPSMNLHD